MKEILAYLKDKIPALKKLIQPLLFIFLIIGVVIFFISFSLARHKQMVAEMRIHILKLETEKKILLIQQEKLAAQQRLKDLSLQGHVEIKKRTEILGKIKKLKGKEKQALEDLKKRKKQLSKESLDSLLKRAKKLEKETL